MDTVIELAWNEIPKAHEVHCWLIIKAPWINGYAFGNSVDFKQDDADTGCWETVLLPKDDLGPTHVVYKRECVEVHRYLPVGGCPELVLSVQWDDPNLLDKVLVAVTEDVSSDWSSLSKPD